MGCYMDTSNIAIKIAWPGVLYTSPPISTVRLWLRIQTPFGCSLFLLRIPFTRTWYMDIP